MYKIVLAVMVCTASACTTVERKGGCDLPPLPDQAFIWWDQRGGLLSLERLPAEMKAQLEIEVRDNGFAAYKGEQSRKIIEDYVTCRLVDM